MTTKRLRVAAFCVGLLTVPGLAVLLWPSPPLYGVTILPSLGGVSSQARATNNLGRVVGSVQSEDGPQSTGVLQEPIPE